MTALFIIPTICYPTTTTKTTTARCVQKMPLSAFLSTTNGDRTVRVRSGFNVLAFDPFRIMVPQPMLAGMPLISNSSNMQRPYR